jgi:hypothetical protein
MLMAELIAHIDNVPDVSIYDALSRHDFVTRMVEAEQRNA